MKKEAEAKRRGVHHHGRMGRFACLICPLAEKLEDAKARAAIKAQIEADKRDRAEKAAREKALREGKPVPGSSAPAASTPAAALIASKTAGRDYPETRLQIRLASGGQPYTTTLSSDASA